METKRKQEFSKRPQTAKLTKNKIYEILKYLPRLQ